MLAQSPSASEEHRLLLIEIDPGFLVKEFPNPVWFFTILNRSIPNAEHQKGQAFTITQLGKLEVFRPCAKAWQDASVVFWSSEPPKIARQRRNYFAQMRPRNRPALFLVPHSNRISQESAHTAAQELGIPSYMLYSTYANQTQVNPELRRMIAELLNLVGKQGIEQAAQNVVRYALTLKTK